MILVLICALFMTLLHSHLMRSCNMIKRSSLLFVLLFVAIQPSVQAVELVFTQSSGNTTYSDSLPSIKNLSIENRYGLASAITLTTTYLRSEFKSNYYISTFGSEPGRDGYIGVKAETEAFNGASYFNFDTITNGTVTHSSTVNAENGFWLVNSVNSQYSYGGYLGSAVVTVSQEVNHYYDADPDSWLYHAADFFVDIYQGGPLIRTITGKVLDIIKSNHIRNQKGKKVFIPPKKYDPCLCVRGSIDLKGNSIFTASPGVLAYDIEFGEDETLTLPFAFGENKDDATLEIFFNDNLLGFVNGSDYELDELNFLDVDITDYTGMSGSLDFVLNTTGTQSANIFIPESLAMSAVPIPSAVWLFGSGLVGLIGAARRKARI